MPWGNPKAAAPVGDDDQPSTDERVFWQISKQHPDTMAVKTHKTFRESRAVQTCVMARFQLVAVFCLSLLPLTHSRHVNAARLARKRNLCSGSVNVTTILIRKAPRTLPSAISSYWHHYVPWEIPPDGHIHHPASEDPAADPRLHSRASHTKCAAPYAFVSGATSSLPPRETADIPALLWQKPARATKQGILRFPTCT